MVPHLKLFGDPRLEKVSQFYVFFFVPQLVFALASFCREAFGSRFGVYL